MTDNLPVQQPQPVIARRPPTPADCWWRLGPNIRDYRTAASRGLCRVVVHRDDGGGFYLEVEIRRVGTYPVWAAGYELTMLKPIYFDLTPHIGSERHEPSQIQSLDLLVDRPPLLPVPLGWQQITRRGDHAHPGDNMHNWRYDNTWT